MRKETRV